MIVCRTCPACRGDQVTELVAAVRSGGQAEPHACRNPALPSGRTLPRGRGDTHQRPPALPGGQHGDAASTHQGLQGDHVDDAAELSASAAGPPGSGTEELANPRPSLAGEHLTADKHQCRDGRCGDHRARDDGLAGPSRCDQHAKVIEARELLPTVTRQRPCETRYPPLCMETPASLWLVGGAPNRIFCRSLFLANSRRSLAAWNCIAWSRAVWD
jgi:hypothetical protein